MSEKQVRRAGGSKSSWFAWLVGLVVIVALVAGLWGFYRYGLPWVKDFQVQQARLKTAVVTLEAADTTLRRDLSVRMDERIGGSARALQGAFQSDLQALTTDIDALAGVEARATATVRRAEQLLRQIAVSDQHAWRLAEAEFMVRLASERLVYASDVTGALGLLYEADALLQTRDGPNISRIRAAIASDRARLQAVPVVDTVGLMAQLSALEEQIGFLDWVGVGVPEGGADSLSGDGESSESILAQSLATLSSYFVVTTLASTEVRPMDSDWPQIAAATVTLQLEQARVSVLTGNTALFSDALSRAESFITDHTRSNDARSASLVRTLAQLSQADLRPASVQITATSAFGPLDTNGPGITNTSANAELP